MSVVGICTAALLVDPMTAGEDEVRAAGEAAVGAGFTSASVWAQHLPALAGTGLAVAVVEAATRWGNGSADDAEREARFFVGAAREHGASLVAAVCLEPSISDRSRARRNLEALVRSAADAGVRVCLEFVPGTAVPNLATAWDLVEPLGPEATVLLDTWHWTRQPGGPAFDLLAGIPGDRIGYVQLCDAGPEPSDDLMTEMMTARLVPGRGVVDFDAVTAALQAIGASPYRAVEVFNPGLVEELGAKGAARTLLDATATLGA